MASLVKIKRSNVAGKIPTTSDISAGELALNTKYGRLFSTDGGKVFEVGANTNSLYVGIGGATFGNGAFSLPTSDGTNGQIITTNGSGTLSWTDSAGQPAVVTSTTVSDLTQNDTVVTSVSSVTSVVDVATLTSDRLTANNRLANTNSYIATKLDSSSYTTADVQAKAALANTNSAIAGKTTLAAAVAAAADEALAFAIALG